MDEMAAPKPPACTLFNEEGQPTAEFIDLAIRLYYFIIPGDYDPASISTIIVLPETTDLCGMPNLVHLRQGARMDIYCNMMDIEHIPRHSSGKPTLTWVGWCQYLMHRIKLDPGETYYQLLTFVHNQATHFTLARTDFPIYRDQELYDKEVSYLFITFGHNDIGYCVSPEIMEILFRPRFTTRPDHLLIAPDP